MQSLIQLVINHNLIRYEDQPTQWCECKAFAGFYTHARLKCKQFAHAETSEDEGSSSGLFCDVGKHATHRKTDSSSCIPTFGCYSPLLQFQIFRIILNHSPLHNAYIEQLKFLRVVCAWTRLKICKKLHKRTYLFPSADNWEENPFLWVSNSNLAKIS